MLRTIDDLFMYAGAQRDWWVKVDLGGEGERLHKFYGWIEGINRHSPQTLEPILMKLMGEILRNDLIPQEELATIDEARVDLQRKQYEQPAIQVESLLSTLARLLAADGLAREVAVVTYSNARLEFVERTQNPLDSDETDIYRLSLQLPLKLVSYSGELGTFPV